MDPPSAGKRCPAPPCLHEANSVDDAYPSCENWTNWEELVGEEPVEEEPVEEEPVEEEEPAEEEPVEEEPVEEEPEDEE